MDPPSDGSVLMGLAVNQVLYAQKVHAIKASIENAHL